MEGRPKVIQHLKPTWKGDGNARSEKAGQKGTVGDAVPWAKILGKLVFERGTHRTRVESGLR